MVWLFHIFNYTTIYYLQLQIIMKTKKHIMKPITDKRTKEIFSLLRQAEQCVDDLENARKKLTKKK